MQMETCAVAGIAYITYNLPCRYRFPCGNGSLRHVGVPRGQACTVVQQHLVAVAVVPAADKHRAARLLLQMAAHRFSREVLAFQRLHFVMVGIGRFDLPLIRRPLPKVLALFLQNRKL